METKRKNCGKTVIGCGVVAGISERRRSQAVLGQHGAGDLSVLSVYRHSGGGGDRKTAAAGLAARIFLALAELGNFLLPITYTVTPEGNYSSGPYMLVPYGAVIFYLLLCAGLLTVNRKQIGIKKKAWEFDGK